MKTLIRFLVLLLLTAGLSAQQPQSGTAPILGNARYVQGVGPGYYPRAGSGLTLTLTAGTANCSGTRVTYAGGTLTMSNNTTNQVYLDTASSCVPAKKTTGYVAADIFIATVVTSGGVITTISDDRTMQIASSGAGATGDTITLNGVATGDANFNNTSPPPPSGATNGINIIWDKTGSGPTDVSARIMFGNSLAIGGSTTLGFNYASQGASPSLGAGECVFDATVPGLACEGATANTIETRVVVTDPTVSDKAFTIPNADSNAVQPLDCGTDFVKKIDSAGLITCATASGGTGASTADSFITVSHDADLTGERILAGTANQIAITDGGVNSTMTLSIPTNPTLPGTTSGTFSGGLTGAVTGNASTATALAADPGNCGAGQAAAGITAAGVAEGCATYLTANQTVTLTGDVTGSGATAITTVNVNLPDGVTQAGHLLVTDIAAPASPTAGKLKLFGDSTDLRFHDKNAAGTIGTTVVSNTCSGTDRVSAVSAAGVVTCSATGSGGGSVTNIDTAGVITGGPITTTGTVGILNQGSLTTVLHGDPAGQASFAAVTEADQTLANNSTNNVSITKHGYAPILPNVATQYLDGTGAYSTPGGGGGTGQLANLQIFNLADTGTNWTLPTNGKIVVVTICGSGGSGGGGSGAAAGAARTGGGGGGGGFCAQRTFRAADITSPVLMTIAAGGASAAGGTAGAGTDGNPGNTSSFGTYINVPGGGGGASNAAGAAGGGGAGCFAVGGSVTGISGGSGGDCFVLAAVATSYGDFRGGGASNVAGGGGIGHGSWGGGGSGGGSSTTGAVLGATSSGGASGYSAGGGAPGGGVNAASPGTAQNGGVGGATGGAITSDTGNGGAAGLTASACGSGGEGQVGNATANTENPGGAGGGGGASKNAATGCAGGNGGVGGGGGGGGGGGTNVGGASGAGGAGYATVWTYF